MYSEDGINWSFITGYAYGRKIIYENNKFVTFVGSAFLFHSMDGNEWTKSSVDSSFRFENVSYANGKWVALDSKKNVSFSENLIDWAIPIQVTDEEGNAISIGLNGICAVP